MLFPPCLFTALLGASLLSCCNAFPSIAIDPAKMARVSFSRLTAVLGLLGAQQVLSNPVPVCEAQDVRGAVASESAVCSRVGIDLLKAGGNAADAVCLPSTSSYSLLLLIHSS